MRTASLIFGVILTAGVTVAAIASMVVPRATRKGLAHVVTRVVFGALRLPLRVLRTYRWQDRWLRLAAPISVLVQLAIFVSLTIIGVAFIIFGQTQLTWRQAGWQAAATVTTLGTTEKVNWSSAITSALGAFLGLVVIAVFMGYLVGLYSAYVARESLMARFAQVAGEPAWGPMVLVRSQVLAGDASDALDCAEWTSWITDVRLGQQASPVLAHFRSPDPMRHWTISVLAMLDATSLALSLGLITDRAASIRCVAEGTITLGVLQHQGLAAETTNWRTERTVLDILDGSAVSSPVRSIDDADWKVAVDLLVDSGVADRPAFDAARSKFEAIRSLYIHDAIELASHLHAVRAPWSGDRVCSATVVWPDECGAATTSESAS